MNALQQKLSDSAKWRWSMLILIAFATFATYFVNDIFSGMKGVMETHMKISSSDYGLLLSAVGYFNMIGMIMVGGIILDKFGIRKVGFALVGLAAFGSFLIAYGSSETFVNGGFGYDLMNSVFPDYSPQLKMMILGRLLFGMGLETCCVMVQKVIVKWFKGHELALAFAINMGIGRFGSSMAIMITPELAGTLADGSYSHFSRSFLFGFILAALALILFLIYTMFDAKLDKSVAAAGEANALEKEKNGESAVQEAPEEKESVLYGLKSLVTNKALLLITALCVTFYSAVFPFVGYVTDMLVNKFGFSLTWASKVAGFFPLGAIFFTIAFGRIVDKKGKAATLMMWGSGLLIFGHLTLSLTSLPPYFALLAIEVAFSLVPAAMWPSVAKLVPERRLGMAYAFMFTIQNWGLTFFFYMIGKVLELSNPGITAEVIDAGKANYNYTLTLLMLAGLGFLGMLFAYLLKREDKRSGTELELPSDVKG
ncbi:MAG: major facilitator superfamily domain-containing protein 1 [bacterium]|nr:major facilitator superfamily domain-containing protein 1 [bacterium]